MHIWATEWTMPEGRQPPNNWAQWWCWGGGGVGSDSACVCMQERGYDITPSLQFPGGSHWISGVQGSEDQIQGAHLQLPPPPCLSIRLPSSVFHFASCFLKSACLFVPCAIQLSLFGCRERHFAHVPSVVLGQFFVQVVGFPPPLFISHPMSFPRGWGGGDRHRAKLRKSLWAGVLAGHCVAPLLSLPTPCPTLAGHFESFSLRWNWRAQHVPIWSFQGQVQQDQDMAH